MARPAQALQVGVVIVAALGFWFDVVNGHGGNGAAIAPAGLADVVIAAQDACPANFPVTAVAAFVSAPALLVLLPPFVAMLLTVA